MSRDDITLNSTSVANLSLSHLGMKALPSDIDTGVTNNNPSAIALDKQWGPSRNDVFREFKWPFANVQALILPRTDVDEDDYPEWLFFTTYPAAAAVIWTVFDEVTVKTKEENMFEVIYNPTLDEKIVCCSLDTQNSAYCEYTYNVTDPTKWDTKFIMAFSFRLAAAICVELTGDGAKAIELAGTYSRYIAEAKRIAHYEKKRKPTQKNDIAEARG